MRCFAAAMTVSTNAPLGSMRSAPRPSGPSCQSIRSPVDSTNPPAGFPSVRKLEASNGCSIGLPLSPTYEAGGELLGLHRSALAERAVHGAHVAGTEERA